MAKKIGSLNFKLIFKKYLEVKSDKNIIYKTNNIRVGLMNEM